MITNRNSISFLTGLFIGGLAGSTLTLLLAPQSGEETRTQIRDQSVELKERIEEQAANAQDRVSQVQEQGRALVEEKTNKAKEVANKSMRVF